MSPKRQLRTGLTVAVLSMGLGAGLAMAQQNGSVDHPGAQAPAPTVTPAPTVNGTATTAGTSTRLDKSDRAFVREAAQANLGEIALGRLAEQNGQDPQVRAFGERMVKDHTQLNDQLTSMAQSLDVTVPTSPSKKDDATLNKLAGLSGAAFDKAYARDMVKDHRMDIRKFEHEAKDARSAQVRQLADSALPTLREHLQLAANLPGAPGRRTASAATGTATQR
ncbi:MAG TPA: DUF4142 domain-containing protein [Steroidobacteraceae bacterium]|nr:DUF4142 domain-containing protein [Steroidobacteraceae bacterium]